ILFPCITLVLWALAQPAGAEPVTLKSTAAATQPPAAVRWTAIRRVQLQETLDGLARQIAEIDANIANLGPKNAAALRFRSVSLAAYQRAWAELTRHDVDFGDPARQESVAGLAEPQR